jgi:hypothetical protein
MKFKIFYGLFVFTSFLLLSSFLSAQNLESESQKEKISFINIKYLDTIQNTKPAEGIPEVDVDYWMKTEFKDFRILEDRLTTDIDCRDYQNNQEKFDNDFQKCISGSASYYFKKNNVPYVLVLLYHGMDLAPCYGSIPNNYELENTTLSILELEYNNKEWKLTNQYRNLKECMSKYQMLLSNTSLGLKVSLGLPTLYSLESGHNFILSNKDYHYFYFQDRNSMNFFPIGSYEISAISFESLNELNFKDNDSSFIENTTNVWFQGLKPYKKTENIKFFLDKGILHAEITQDGFIYDPEKEKEIPQNAKTYYRYSEEKKIFTKLE